MSSDRKIPNEVIERMLANNVTYPPADYNMSEALANKQVYVDDHVDSVKPEITERQKLINEKHKLMQIISNLDDLMTDTRVNKKNKLRLHQVKVDLISQLTRVKAKLLICQ